MPTLTYGHLNRARPALDGLAKERHYASQRVAVKVARMHGVARREFEPVEEASKKLLDEYGQVGDIKCPHCRGSLWKSDIKRVMPNNPRWGEYQEAEKEILDSGAVEFREVLLLSELRRFVIGADGRRERDEDGIALTEQIPLSPEEMDALGELLVIDEIEEDEEEPEPEPAPAAATKPSRNGGTAKKRRRTVAAR